MAPKELKQIIKFATARRATLTKRLKVAQEKQDIAKCDQLYMRLSFESQIIENATRDLEAVE